MINNILIRKYIQFILNESIENKGQDLKARPKSRADVYRALESVQNIFSYNGTRLTLIDKQSRPFTKMSSNQIDDSLVKMITAAGYEVQQAIPPKAEGAKSNKYVTYMIAYVDEEGNPEELTYPIVFGYAFSAAESIQFSEINSQINKFIETQPSKTINIFVGDEYKEIDSAKRVGAKGEKQDVVLELNEETQVLISLKHIIGGKANTMQQWCGLSDIQDNDEVKSFIEDVKSNLIEDQKMRFYRRINSDELKNYAVWGDNINIIIAGSTISLGETEEGYEFKVRDGYIWYRTDGGNIADDFEPVFFARPSSDRSFESIKGMRGMICPIGLARSGNSIEI